MLISGKGVPIVESTEIFDANYFTYAVPEDVLPSCVSFRRPACPRRLPRLTPHLRSTFLDLGLDASSPSKASSSPTGTAGTPTSKPASTRAAASAGPAVSHAAVSTSASTSDESDTGAASESTSSHWWVGLLLVAVFVLAAGAAWHLYRQRALTRSAETQHSSSSTSSSSDSSRTSSSSFDGLSSTDDERSLPRRDLTDPLSRRLPRQARGKSFD